MQEEHMGRDRVRQPAGNINLRMWRYWGLLPVKPCAKLRVEAKMALSRVSGSRWTHCGLLRRLCSGSALVPGLLFLGSAWGEPARTTRPSEAVCVLVSRADLARVALLNQASERVVQLL